MKKLFTVTMADYTEYTILAHDFNHAIHKAIAYIEENKLKEGSSIITEDGSLNLTSDSQKSLTVLTIRLIQHDFIS